jgi:hypothetical protein
VGPEAGMNVTEKRKLSYPLPGIEPRLLGSPAHSLVAISSSLFYVVFTLLLILSIHFSITQPKCYKCLLIFINYFTFNETSLIQQNREKSCI